MKKLIKIRKSFDRGHAEHGWLDSHFTFSFADYYDPAHMQFRALRVINEDRVKPGEGFGMHPHRDMEIFTYVIEGVLAHKDSMGHASTIKAGQVQKITAGTGITHSEFNASKTDPVHLLQIWILPDKRGLKPSYEEHDLPGPDSKNSLFLMGAPAGKGGLVDFNQNVYVYRGILKKGQTIQYEILPPRGVWLQMVKGQIVAGEDKLTDGDGAAIENFSQIIFEASQDSEFLLFDLA